MNHQHGLIAARPGVRPAPPLIGLTTYGRLEHDLATAHYDRLYYLPDRYVDCIRRAGGMPVLVPPGEQALPALLDRLDGIVLTGGADLEPRWYDGDPDHPHLGPVDPERDRAELAAARLIAERPHLPALGVCRGFQVLNVALGGSLVEHVPDLGRGDMHRSADGMWTLHDVAVEPGSRLAAAMGATTVRTTSGHHQAVRRLAAGLTITARAADGLIEGFEHAGHPWLVAVQWHPELTAAEDPSQQGLFCALVEAARAGAALPARRRSPAVPAV